MDDRDGGDRATAGADEPIADEFALAIRAGDLDVVARLVAAHPHLPVTRFVSRDGSSRTALHVITDWPGYFPRGPEMVGLLVDAGADPNAAASGSGGTGRGGTGGAAETPLHWAASTDDVEVAEALIDLGADLEAPGGSIAGTPLANAVGYGCWHVARLLVGRGALVGSLWQAAALGDRRRIDEFLAADPAPSQDALDEAFWQACHGGQRRAAEYLVARGASVSGLPGYAGRTSALEVAGEPDTRRQALVAWLTERGAVPRSGAG